MQSDYGNLKARSKKVKLDRIINPAFPWNLGEMYIYIYTSISRLYYQKNTHSRCVFKPIWGGGYNSYGAPYIITLQKTITIILKYFPKSKCVSYSIHIMYTKDTYYYIRTTKYNMTGGIYSSVAEGAKVSSDKRV